MSEQNSQLTMSLKGRLSETLHRKLMVLTNLENRFPDRDFGGVREALRGVDAVLRHFNPKYDGALVQFNLDRAEKLMLSVALAGVIVTPGTKPEKPCKTKRPMTGHFIGEAAPVKTSALNGPNVIGHVTPEMAAALRRQRQLAGLEVPKRGVAVHIVNGHKKRAGKKG